MIDRSSESGPRCRKGRLALAVVLALVVMAAVAVPIGTASAAPRRAATGPIPLSDQKVCNGPEWGTGHIRVGVSGCQAVFDVGWAKNYTYWFNTTNLTLNTSSPYNISFALSWIAEVTPAGQVVRVGSPLDPFAAVDYGNWTGGPWGQLNAFNVTNASGAWNPNATWSGSRTPWNVSSSPVNTSWIIVSFELQNASTNGTTSTVDNPSYSVEFSVFIGGWPWASTADHLGFDLEALGALGSHFSFNSTARTLGESWNVTNQTFVSMVFGSSANVNETSNFPETPTTASVSEQAGVFPATSYDREAQVLVSFGGVAGGYWNVTYDPWVVFSPTTTVVPPGPMVPASNGFPAWTWVAVAAVATLALFAGIGGIVLRDLRLHREGQQLVDGMRRAIAQVPRPPNRGG